MLDFEEEIDILLQVRTPPPPPKKKTIKKIFKKSWNIKILVFMLFLYSHNYIYKQDMIY